MKADGSVVVQLTFNEHDDYCARVVSVVGLRLGRAACMDGRD